MLFLFKVKALSDTADIIACSSSSLTGSAFEPAGDIADEESEIITSDSGLQNSMQDEDWEDLADTKV